MARKDTVLVYDPDPRYYVTAEQRGVHRWFRLWFQTIVEAETTRQDADELRALLEERRLDPTLMRPPTEEEQRP